MSFRFSAPFRVLITMLGLACVLFCAPPLAHANAAADKLAAAETAWHNGELENARKLYEDALAGGGLSPKQVVIAYSRIGTVKAALRDKNGALSAFRVAAAVDPQFELPDDSGPIAKKLYAQARADAAQQGQKLTITVKAPDTTKEREPFTVQTTIPAGFAVLVSQVVVTVRDPLTSKEWRKSQAAQPSLTFQFPGRVAIPGAKLKIHVAAMDSQSNEWAVADAHTDVSGKRILESMNEVVSPFADDSKKDQGKQEKSKSLLSGPVPWIVGGALVVGGIILFAVTRSSSDVSVGAPTWSK
jgi:hypothetical protein